MSATNTVNLEETTPIIPKTCKAGVVVNPGPDFRVCLVGISVLNWAEQRNRSRSKTFPYRTLVGCSHPLCLTSALTSPLGPEDVLIKLNVTGLCMSDVHFMMEDWGLPPM